MPAIAPGSDFDPHGCIVSAGYVWCELVGKCVRLWEQMCRYPDDCLTWNDGCNLCSLSDGVLGACTERWCITQEMPHCEVMAPEVVNPFLSSGGH